MAWTFLSFPIPQVPIVHDHLFSQGPCFQSTLVAEVPEARWNSFGVTDLKSLPSLFEESMFLPCSGLTLARPPHKLMDRLCSKGLLYLPFQGLPIRHSHGRRTPSPWSWINVQLSAKKSSPNLRRSTPKDCLAFDYSCIAVLQLSYRTYNRNSSYY